MHQNELIQQAQREPNINHIQKLGARLADLLDEDQFSECEQLLLDIAASQAQQEPYGWHIKGMENAGMPNFFTPHKLDAIYWRDHGMTLVPVYLQSQAQQDHIGDSNKLVKAINALAAQTGESPESITEWLTDKGGLTQLMLSHFGGMQSQAQQPRGNLAINNLAKQILSDCGFHVDHDKDVYHRIRSRIIESQAQQTTELSDKCKVAASCLTYNDTEKEAVAKHLLLEASQQLCRVQAQQESQWISVEERLPEENCHLLVACEGGNVATTFYAIDHSFFDHAHGYKLSRKVHGKYSKHFELARQYGYKITHWMPLPPAPEGEKS